MGSSGYGSRYTEVRDDGSVVLAGKGPKLIEIRLDDVDVCGLDVSADEGVEANAWRVDVG